MATDPVCGMYVDEATATLRLVRENRTYYFCASSCLETFAQPEARTARLRRRLSVAALGAAVAVAMVYLPVPSWGIWVALAAATVVQFYPGLDFYRGAWDALRNRIGNMDLLVAVGTSAAFGYSAAVVLLPGRLPPAVYFDASTLIVTLILAGNYLEQATRSRASGTLTRLAELTPATALRLGDGAPTEVPITEVRAGDRVRVAPGGRMPADGVVLTGESEIDESILTGESRAVAKRTGDRVLAGSVNGTGLLEVRVTRAGADTFLADVGRLVQEAEVARVPLQRTADRIAQYFAPAVLIGGVAAAVGWWAFGGAAPTTALLIFVSVVITACPCAFGIATPAAILAGTGRAAESGILFRGEDAIERAARVDLVLFDKTGTLTRGTPTLTTLVAAPTLGADRLLSMAAAVEADSAHPWGKAVLRRAQEAGLTTPASSRVRAIPGVGVEGSVEDHSVFVGRWTADHSPLDPALIEAVGRLQSGRQGGSVVRIDGTVVGVLGVSDPPVPEAATAVAELRRDRIQVGMITGDGQSVAEEVGRGVGITEVQAQLLPAAKVEAVRAAQSTGRRVAVVGDGINDAAALSAADVGIAVGTGTDVAKEAGQVLLLRADLRNVPTGLSIARATVRKVRQNLLWAIGYNAVLLPIAAGALVPVYGFSVYAVLPITGAIAMALSSTLVVLNSLSLRRLRDVLVGRPRPDPARSGATGA